MIQKDKVQILEGVLQAAKEVLAMHSKFSDSATRALARVEVYLEHATNPKDILDMYRRIHDMQMQSFATLGSIGEVPARTHYTGATANRTVPQSE